MALKNRVPVVPCFITMADSDLVGADGFPVQEYTPHLGAPIWPDETLSRPAAREQLRQKTEDFCRETYEVVHGICARNADETEFLTCPLRRKPSFVNILNFN